MALALVAVVCVALAFYLFVKLWPKDEKDDVAERRADRACER